MMNLIIFIYDYVRNNISTTLQTRIEKTGYFFRF
jgi:hypothetical protein